MKHRTTFALLIGASLCGAAVAAQADPTIDGFVPSRTGAEAVGSARVPFIANQGQVSNPDVRYYARTFAGMAFVTADERLVYSVPVTDATGATRTWAFSETFVGRRAVARPADGLPSAVHASSFTGSDPATWRTDLEAFDSVDLGELYPGVRATLRAAGATVEKLFHISPGGDAGSIEISIDGVDRMATDADGRLVVSTAAGDLAFSAPVAFQTVGGRRQPVEVAYAPSDSHTYGFRVGSYDHDHDLVIDPLLASTYLGGSNPSPPGNYDDDLILGMVTAGGDVYVAGATQSPDFPIHLGYDDTLANSYPDGFITRMSGDLSTVIASTYIGTDGFDRVSDLILDSDGTVIAVGQAGYGFPVTPGAYTWSGTTPTGGGFVARLSADLGNLIASSIVTPSDYPTTVALGNGAIYFGGSTNNPGFPITANAYRSTCCAATGSFGIREANGFAGRLSADLGTLEALTYLGGNVASGIAVAPDGSVFITDGFDSAITGSLARFDAALTNRSAYLSYYPGSTSGSSRTYFNGVAATQDSVVVVGQTYMNDLPATAGAFDTTCGTDGVCDGVGSLLVPHSDAFVAVYSEDLQTRRALSFLGGSDHESARAVAIGADGDIFVTGETTSIDFPTTGDGADTGCGQDGSCDPEGPFEHPVADGFVVRLSADLSTLKYGTYLGGSGVDQPRVVTVNDDGTVYAAGSTASWDFPATPDAFDLTYNGGTSDAFITRIDAGAPATMIFENGFEVGGLSGWGGGN